MSTFANTGFVEHPPRMTSFQEVYKDEGCVIHTVSDALITYLITDVSVYFADGQTEIVDVRLIDFHSLTSLF